MLHVGKVAARLNELLEWLPSAGGGIVINDFIGIFRVFSAAFGSFVIGIILAK